MKLVFWLWDDLTLINFKNRPPPDVLVNISVPDDVDELTQQSDLFERACNERIPTRKTTGDGSLDDDEDEDDETWLKRGRRPSR